MKKLIIQFIVVFLSTTALQLYAQAKPWTVEVADGRKIRITFNEDGAIAEWTTPKSGPVFVTLKEVETKDLYETLSFRAKEMRLIGLHSKNFLELVVRIPMEDHQTPMSFADLTIYEGDSSPPLIEVTRQLISFKTGLALDLDEVQGESADAIWWSVSQVLPRHSSLRQTMIIRSATALKDAHVFVDRGLDFALLLNAQPVTESDTPFLARTLFVPLIGSESILINHRIGLRAFERMDNVDLQRWTLLEKQTMDETRRPLALSLNVKPLDGHPEAVAVDILTRGTSASLIKSPGAPFVRPNFRRLVSQGNGEDLPVVTCKTGLRKLRELGAAERR